MVWPGFPGAGFESRAEGELLAPLGAVLRAQLLGLWFFIYINL